jgi:ribonuclease III
LPRRRARAPPTPTLPPQAGGGSHCRRTIRYTLLANAGHLRRVYSPAVAGPPPFDELEERLGYRFTRSELLRDALTHRSYANEHPGEDRSDNEKLEFLGDAVLDLVVGHMLMDRFPALREGELSITRAQVVSEAGLREVAEELELGRWLYLGVGEERSGGRAKASILGDSVEAVIAAVYLDGGFEAAWELIGRLFAARIGRVELSGFYDFKTRLQESSQALLRATPVYEVVGESGPDHDKRFEVRVLIKKREWARAVGRSKKEAEQAAAASAGFLLDGADLEALAEEERELEQAEASDGEREAEAD